ncbi:MAG TPA: VanZ family protein [Albitalea sp.]
MASHRSSAAPLAGIYAALVVYASLYPFAGWRLPGLSVWAFMSRPWWQWWTWFDITANLLGYLPLGALVFGACVRSGWGAGRSFAAALAGGAALSFAMEALQNFLPQRVSSNVDLALNVAGTLLGALVGLAVHLTGVVERWQAVRDRWFIDRSAGGLALLVLWPVGLLFPGPVPFAFGQFWPRLRDTLAEWLQDSAVAPWVAPWLEPGDAGGVLSAGGEFMAISLGLLAPCMVAFTISRPGWRRLVLAVGAAALGLLALTLSTALNFGPQHSLAWRTPPVEAALAMGLFAAAALGWVPRRAAAGLGLIALAALVTLVAQVPADAYFAESLQAWEQGRFIRFHGAAQWIGWLWPYVAMGYLLARIAARDPE